MQTFDIYKHQKQGYEAVKIGFSWPGFLLSCFWAFYYKLWGQSLGFVFVSLFLITFAQIFNSEANSQAAMIMLILEFALILMFGEKGNEWKKKSLLEQGYLYLQTMTAKDYDAAKSALSRHK